mgnify:CR=1 FL=1
MIKIDLHIHTVTTQYDPNNFAFDARLLERYVSEAHLDVIAITNHNVFSRTNYEELRSSLCCEVLPGIEINVSTPGTYGHVLVVSSPDDIDSFAESANAVEAAVNEAGGYISWTQVVELIPGINKYLVIPHYKKKKRNLDRCTLEEIRSSTGIDALEVSSPKQWLKGDPDVSEPLVLFSDSRPGLRMPHSDDDETRYSYGSCFVKCEEPSLPAIKSALALKQSVSLFHEESEFEILPEGLPVSKGTNVLLGNRSTGKTYTLKRIMDGLEEGDYAYIEQFQITAGAKKEEFEKKVNADDKSFRTRYLSSLQRSLDLVLSADLQSLMASSESWCEELIQFAHSPEDDTSKLPIYNEVKYPLIAEKKSREGDFALRLNAEALIFDSRRKSTIEKYVSDDALRALVTELREIGLEEHRDAVFKTKANSCLGSIQSALKEFSSRKPLPATDPIRSLFVESYREHRMIQILEKLESSTQLDSEIDSKFKKVRTRYSTKNATEARDSAISKMPKDASLSGLFKKNATWESRISTLRSMPDDVKNQGAYLFFGVKTSIVSNDLRETPLSGGQRAEYLFLRLLEESRNKDIVLIDEPESSFDNEFLRYFIVPMIKELSTNSTVFLVTHNNTLGVSLEPDWIIYATKTNEGQYDLYSGHLTSSTLRNTRGDAISRPDKLLETMEAGADAYQKRRNYYEIA